MKLSICCGTTIATIYAFLLIIIPYRISFAQGNAEQEAKLNARVKAAEEAVNKLPSHEKKLDWRLYKFIKGKEKEKLTGQAQIRTNNNQSMNSLCMDNQNRIHVNVVLLHGKEKELLSVENLIQNSGGSVRLKTTETLNTPVEIYCWLPYDKISEIAKHPAVGHICPVARPIKHVGQENTSGDSQLKADLAREYFYKKGDGIIVGVISDGAKYYSNSVTSGDLPSTFGPSNIVYTGDTSGSEGTAMLEIVHDLAPDATLYFGGIKLDGTEGPNDMATRITELKNKGCKIIVDDIGFLGNAQFTADYLYNTIQDFISITNNRIYISAAMNFGQSCWDGDFFNDQSNWLLFWYQNGQYLNYNQIDNLEPGQSVTIVLQWSNKWDWARQDYDLYLLDAFMQVVDSSCNVQGSQGSEPYEIIDYKRPENTLPQFYIRVKKKDQTNVNNEIRLVISQEVDLKYTYPNYVSGETKPRRQIFGHAIGCISVAANPSNNQNVLEDFSSRGPSNLYNFSSDGITWTVQTINTPTISATDGVRTKVGADGHFLEYFTGTSASAPHVAGIAAIYYSKYSDGNFQAALIQGADTMKQYGPGRVYNDQCGYGKANALEALIYSLPSISPGVVSSNTTWADVKVIGVSNTINSGIIVSIPENKTCVLNSSIVFADNTAKIVVSGTLFIRSGMNINQDQVIAQIPNGVVIYEGASMKQVTVSQVDELNQPFDSVGVWKSNRFENNAVPFRPTWELRANKTLRAKQDFKISTTQKYRMWKNRDSIQNHQFFAINEDVDEITSQFTSTSNATVQAQLFDGGNPGGSVDFMDPWLIDKSDARFYDSPYGYRNLGMSAPFKSVAYAQNNIGIASRDSGVFLLQGYPYWNSPYYTVRALQTQPIGNFTGIFQNWTVTSGDASFKNENALETGVVFKQANTTVTAKYKAHLGSNTLQATTGNTGRKVAIFGGKTFAVYTSGGCIWFSRNDGSGWSNEYPIDVSGNAKNPSITTTNQGSCVYVVWEVNNSGTRTVYYRRSTNQGISWDNPINVSTSLGRNLTSVEDANPVVFGTSYAIVVFRAAQQPGQGCLYAWWHTNMFPEAILYPTHTNSYLPAGVERGFLGNYVYAYHLVFVYGQKIYYAKLNVNTQALHITNDTPVEIPGSSGGTNPTVSQWGDIGAAWENTSDHKIYYSQSTYTGSSWTTLPPITHSSHQLTQPSVNFDASDNPNIKVNLLWQCSSHVGMVSKPVNSSTWSSVVDLGTATGPNVTPQAWEGTPLTIQRTIGSVAPYKINIIAFISGNNNLWSGTRLIEGDVTVNAGATLTISPGAVISFANGAKLIVNGTLNANGTSSSRITLTRNGTTNWGGIQYNAGSSGGVSYCDISYAVKGIYCNGSSPAISNNSITNCSGHGIYSYNATPYITWNMISYNGCGIFSQYSPQYMFLCHDTIIYNQGCGLDFYDTDVWLSPQFPYPNCCPGYGYNAIRQNGTGISAAYSSNVCLGQGIYECKNCVHNNTGLEINGAYGSNIYADQTFWNRPNPYHPLVSDYSLNYSSTFTHNSPLNYDPNGCVPPQPSIVDGTSSELLNSPLQKTITVETTASVDEDLLQIVQLEIEGKLVEAIALSKFQWQNELKKSASSSPEEIVKWQAKKRQILGHLSFCYRMAGRNDFVDFLNKEIRPKLSIYDELYAATIELENRYLVNNGIYEKAIDNWKLLKTRYAKNEAVYKYALYNLGYVYYEQFDDKAKGKEYFDELMARYPNDELTLHCKLLLGETDGLTNSHEPIPKKGVTSEANIPDKMMLLDNYPNPFNPVTKIEYQLPEAARVSLKVYDMLGREVATLVDEEKDAGYHATTFDGIRFSSGVYFTRFIVNPLNGSHKGANKPFVQVKKMMLTK